MAHLSSSLQCSSDLQLGKALQCPDTIIELFHTLSCINCRLSVIMAGLTQSVRTWPLPPPAIGLSWADTMLSPRLHKPSTWQCKRPNAKSLLPEGFLLRLQEILVETSTYTLPAQDKGCGSAEALITGSDSTAHTSVSARSDFGKRRWRAQAPERHPACSAGRTRGRCWG